LMKKKGTRGKKKKKTQGEKKGLKSERRKGHCKKVRMFRDARGGKTSGDVV